MKQLSEKLVLRDYVNFIADFGHPPHARLFMNASPMANDLWKLRQSTKG